MKATRFLLTIFTASTLLFASCSSDDDSNSGTPTAAAGTVVASVNGAAFESISSGTRATLINNSGAQFLNVIAINLNGESLQFTITDSNIENGNSYDISDANTIANTGVYTRTDTSTFVTTSYSAPYENSGDVGTITIDEITGTNVRGSFTFSPANQDDRSDVVNITNGAFNLEIQ